MCYRFFHHTSANTTRKFREMLLAHGARLTRTRGLTRAKVSSSLPHKRHALHVAALQLSVGPDPTDNLGRAEALIDEAALAGASLVGLPECFVGSYGTANFHKWAERVPRSLAEADALQLSGGAAMLCRSAAAHRITAMGGVVEEEVEEVDVAAPPSDQTTARLYNTTVVYGPGGDLVARYRKIHLSRVLGITSESDVFSAGAAPTTFSAALPPTQAAAWAAASPPTCESDDGSRGGTPHVGLLCCFDLRFSGILRQYTPSGSHGQCDLLFAPSAFLDATGVDHWDLLVRRAALDTQTFVVAPNVAYRHDDPTPLHGRSLICDPWGRIVAQCGAEGDAVVLAEVEPRVLAETRAKLPIFELAHRFE